jgi:hypothetical protein
VLQPAATLPRTLSGKHLLRRLHCEWSYGRRRE